MDHEALAVAVIVQRLARSADQGLAHILWYRRQIAVAGLARAILVGLRLDPEGRDIVKRIVIHADRTRNAPVGSTRATKARRSASAIVSHNATNNRLRVTAAISTSRRRRSPAQV